MPPAAIRSILVFVRSQQIEGQTGLPLGASAPERLAAAALVAVMAAGSLAVWTAVPAAWLWLSAQVGGSNQFSFLVALVACPITMMLAVQGLARVHDAYLRVSGRPAALAPRSAWLRPISGERGAGKPRTILDVFMIVSGVLAFLALGAWLALYAGSPLTGLGI